MLWRPGPGRKTTLEAGAGGQVGGGCQSPWTSLIRERIPAENWGSAPGRGVMDAEEAGITDVRGAGGLASLSGGGAVSPSQPRALLPANRRHL